MQKISPNIPHTKKYPFYVIEGIDGSGKSTLASLWSCRIGGIHCECPPEMFSSARDSIDREASTQARFLFYLASNLQASSEISVARVSSPVICVRYFYSTIAYHIVKGVDLDWLFSIARLVNFELPDKVFWLDVLDEQKVFERLSQRGFLPEDKRMLDKAAHLREAYSAVFKHFPEFIYIDTSDLTPSALLERLISYIGNSSSGL